MNRSALWALARLYGVQPAYCDYLGRPTSSSDEAVLAVLAALGAPPIADLDDVREPIAARVAELRSRTVPPARVCWSGRPAVLPVALPPGDAGRPVEFDLELESGATLGWSVTPGEEAEPQRSGDGLVVHVPLPQGLPEGYHTLHTTVGRARHRTLVIAAPQRAYQPGPPDRWWGAFVPLYAVHTQRPWHTGDYTDLRRLAGWVHGLGGQMVGTLPLLAAFLEGDPYDHSPYAPASRLAWNELYVDVEAAPEFATTPAVRELMASPAFAEAVAAMAAQRWVDYPALYRLKRQALRALAQACFDGPAARAQALRRFLQQRPLVREYARFRAAGERWRAPWQSWPHGVRSGALHEGDFDPADAHYHEYVQFLASEQLAAASGEGAGLYMDLPLGVHASGFDTWRFREVFADGAACGAPPDGLFVGGQDWGFPPLHPERLRASGYGYFIEVLRHHMRYARVLRMDHVMGLYRQYWVPAGFRATAGAYVRYPAEELFAIVCLESHRHQCAVVGENLGTVPETVNQLMHAHGLRPMYVLQFSPTFDPAHPFADPDPAALASLNTHDTPTFTGWWQGLDIDDKLDLGLIDPVEAAAEREERALMRAAVEGPGAQLAPRRPAREPMRERVARVLRWLAGTSAWAVLVNLEDLLAEPQPQNVPGTYRERPNWLRKAAASLEEIMSDPHVVRALRAVARARRRP